MQIECFTNKMIESFGSARWFVPEGWIEGPLLLRRTEAKRGIGGKGDPESKRKFGFFGHSASKPSETFESG